MVALLNILAQAICYARMQGHKTLLVEFRVPDMEDAGHEVDIGAC